MKTSSCALPGPGPGLQPGTVAGLRRLDTAGCVVGKGRRWRYITILFSDLCGSVELAEELDALDYVRAVQHLRAVTRRVVGASGGTIARLQGDGVLVFFHGDAGPQEDGRRAVACALALHTAVRARSGGAAASRMRPLALHSGIHAGITYLDDGDIERGRYDLIGRAPNIAARLAALAGRDQILASDVVLCNHAASFPRQGMKLVQLRGCAQPLPTYELVGSSGEAGWCHGGNAAGIRWGGAPATLHA
jgi:class 3 adenylate cyclase